MMIEPYPGKIIAKPLVREEMKTSSGVFIPQKTAEQIRYVIGKVVAVADYQIIDGEQKEMLTHVGDYLYFDELTSREFKVRGEQFYCLGEDQVYGKIKDFNSTEFGVSDVE